MSVLLRRVSQEVEMPSTLSYERGDDPVQQKVHWCWNFFHLPLQALGQTLRNAFYLPWLSKKVDPDLELNHQLAERMSHALQNSKVICHGERDKVRRCFSIRDIRIELQGAVSQIVTLRLFESKRPIAGKKLRIILFSFNGNLETHGDNPSCKWNPLTMQALSEMPIFVLKALRSTGLSIDSLATTSLGNVMLDGLQHTAEDFDILPPILIINRGLTRIRKAADQLYSFPINYLLYGAAKLSGWNANPEQALLDFLEREHQAHPLSQRKVIFIEAMKDFYFSEKGRFNLDTHERIAELGHRVFRANFYPFPFHARAHHALSLDHLVNNMTTEILSDTAGLDLDVDEKLSSAIAKNIFLAGNSEWHTCFYVCGNDATLAIGTEREIMPLLSAFIEEGEKRAQAGLGDDYKEQAM